MWAPRPLATLVASTACNRDIFTFTLWDIVQESANKSNHPVETPLLLVTQPWTRDNIQYRRLPVKLQGISTNMRRRGLSYMQHDGAQSQNLFKTK
jgi:hypothetical protein